MGQMVDRTHVQWPTDGINGRNLLVSGIGADPSKLLQRSDIRTIDMPSLRKTLHSATPSIANPSPLRKAPLSISLNLEATVGNAKLFQAPVFRPSTPDWSIIRN